MFAETSVFFNKKTLIYAENNVLEINNILLQQNNGSSKQNVIPA